jgi:hypothetical protein
MKTLFLLITLTQNGAGDINASFVNTQTLEQCQQKALTVEGVFQASTIPVIESRCIKSDLQFSEFGHASTASKIRNFYLIKLDEKSLQISTMPDWRTCMNQQRSGELLSGMQQGRVYCSSSVQSLI